MSKRLDSQVTQQNEIRPYALHEAVVMDWPRP